MSVSFEYTPLWQSDKWHKSKWWPFAILKCWLMKCLCTEKLWIKDVKSSELFSLPTGWNWAGDFSRWLHPCPQGSGSAAESCGEVSVYHRDNFSLKPCKVNNKYISVPPHSCSCNGCVFFHSERSWGRTSMQMRQQLWAPCTRLLPSARPSRSNLSWSETQLSSPFRWVQVIHWFMMNLNVTLEKCINPWWGNWWSCMLTTLSDGGDHIHFATISNFF